MKWPGAIFNGSFTGEHFARGRILDADSVVALEFGHRPSSDENGVGLPNFEIAQKIAEDDHLRTLPMFVSHSIAVALGRVDPQLQPTKEFEGESAHGLRENLGTYGELLQARQLLAEHGLVRPAIITNRYNIGNVVFQALKIGMYEEGERDFVVPYFLPESFDLHSDQRWTRNRRWWRALTYPRLARLRMKGH